MLATVLFYPIRISFQLLYFDEGTVVLTAIVAVYPNGDVFGFCNFIEDESPTCDLGDVDRNLRLSTRGAKQGEDESDENDFGIRHELCSRVARENRRQCSQSHQQASCEGTHQCLVALDLLAAAVYENGHWVASFQCHMQKLFGAVDADPETAATPLSSKFQGSPTCGQFWIEGDPVLQQRQSCKAEDRRQPRAAESRHVQSPEDRCVVIRKIDRHRILEVPQCEVGVA